MNIQLLQTASRRAGTPTVDTRGVQLRDGTPLFVDVHPDMSLPPPQSQ